MLYQIEICTVEISISSNKIFLLGVYRPHSGDIEGFINSFSSIISDRMLNGATIVIMGDINVNILFDNPEVQNFMHFFQIHHFFPLIRKPTRFPSDASGSPTLLDHIWINSFLNTKSGIISIDLTDHCPTFLFLPVNKIIPDDGLMTVQFRNLSTENFNLFTQEICCFDWSSIRDPDISVYSFNFISKLNTIYCSCFPLQSKTISKKRLSKAWLTPRVFKLVKLKSEYFRLFRRGLISREENSHLKNSINSQIRAAKRNYFNYIFKKYSKDIRMTWKTINLITSKCRNSKTIKTILINNIECFDSPTIANFFNQYFSNIAIELETQIPPSDIDPLTDVPRIRNSFFLSPVTVDETKLIVKSLNNT